MMNACASEDLDDIEDLLLPDGVRARHNKNYVMPRAARRKTSTQQQTLADSVIPGMVFI